MPTSNQILGAEIRAAEEAFYKKNRRPYQGGFEVPSQEKKLAYLAHKFGMSSTEVSYFLTYSRECTHPWSAGACNRCPSHTKAVL